MKIHSIYDNDGKTIDRYTVYYKGIGALEHRHNGVFRACLGMSERPCHPQGFGQHGSGLTGKHNGRRINFTDLPEACQRAVTQDLS